MRKTNSSKQNAASGFLLTTCSLLPVKDVLIFLILGVLAIGFFHSLFFLDQLPSFRDIYLFAYPMKVFASSVIKQGLIPLWDPYSGLGIPFFANLQSEVFYPPNFLFYLLPIKIALKLFITLHFFLSGWFTYLFTRGLKVSRLSALISAIVFTFSGSLVSTIDTTSALCAMTWLPLVLFLNHKTLQTFEVKWILLMAFVLSIQFLAGFPEVFVLTILLIGFMTIVKGFELAKNRRRRTEFRGGGLEVRNHQKPGFKPQASCLRYLAYCLLPFAIVSGLIMFQLLPFLELLGLSTRSQGLTYEKASQGALHPGHLVNLLIPDFYGNPMEIRPTPIPEGWLKGIYVGLLPLILAILAPFLIKRDHQKMGKWENGEMGNFLFSPFPLAILSLFTILLSLGDHFFLYPIFFPLGLHIFRFPAKFFLLAGFTLSILSGYGVEGFQNLVQHHDKRKRWMVAVFLIILTGLGTFCVLVWTKFGLQLIPKFYGLTSSFTLESVPIFFSNTLIPSFRFLVILFLSSGILLLALYQKLSLILVKGLVLILVTLDLFIHNLTLMPVVHSEVFGFSTGTIDFLKTELNRSNCEDNLVTQGTFFGAPETSSCLYPFRVYSMPLTQQGTQFLLATNKYDEQALLTATDLLIPNLSGIFQIPNAMTKGSVELASYEHYRNRLELKVLLSRFNVKYIISTIPLNIQEFDLIREGFIKIFQNKTFLPRTYEVEVPHIPALFNFSEISVSRVIPLKIEQPTPHHIKIVRTGFKPALTEEGNRWLVLSAQYYPGWRAYRGDQEIVIQEVDDLFMGLELAPGSHQIEFKYLPNSFKVGLFISLWTILVIMAFISWQCAVDSM